MPWIRRSTASFRFYWILATIACAMVGVSAGYSWWGESAAVVNIVERELKNSQVQMRRLEKRIEVLETKLGIESDSDSEPDQTVKAY